MAETYEMFRQGFDPTEEGVIVRLSAKKKNTILYAKSKMLHEAFKNASGGESFRVSAWGGKKFFFINDPKIQQPCEGVTLDGAGEDLILQNGDLNLSILKSVSLDKGLELSFEFPLANNDAKAYRDIIGYALKNLGKHLMSTSEMEVIMIMRDKKAA